MLQGSIYANLILSHSADQECPSNKKDTRL